MCGKGGCKLGSSAAVRSRILKGKVKGKAVPLATASGPEGSRKLTFTDFITTAEGGGKDFSLRHRPPLP